MPRGLLRVALLREAAGDYELRLSLLSERAARCMQRAHRAETQGDGGVGQQQQPQPARQPPQSWSPPGSQP